MRIRALLGALVTLAAAPAALAETIKVPSPGIPTIQAAVDYAWPGDVILVGPGEYADPVLILQRTGIEIRGAGWPRLVANINILLSSEITLRGLDFDGSQVDLSSSDDVKLVGNRFHDRAGVAIDARNSDRLLISRCLFRDLAAAALEGDEQADMVVERCRFEDILEFAVFLSSSLPGSDRVVFSRNRILRAGGGIRCNGEDLVVEDNRMAGLEGAAIANAETGNDSRGIYRRNRIQTTAPYAIENDGSATLVEKNTIVGGGIVLYGSACLVRGNRVTDAAIEAIQVAAPALVEKNQIRGGIMGIGVQGDGSSLVGNTITGTLGAGISLGAQDCRLSKNRVTGSGGIGIQITGTGHLVTENRASGSATVDLADESAEGVNTYISNKFGTIDFDAIF